MYKIITTFLILVIYLCSFETSVDAQIRVKYITIENGLPSDSTEEETTDEIEKEVAPEINEEASETNDEKDVPETNEAPVKNEANTRHTIPWRFNVYNEPSLTAAIEGTYTPQTVTVLESNDNGWALIETYRGAYWTYLKENLLYINKYTSLFNNKGDQKSEGAISPQIVKIIEQENNWILIETYLGNKWLNLNGIRDSVLLDVPSYSQRALGYPSGCEIVSLGMMINYKVEADVKALVSKMPQSIDPNVGFRGEPRSSTGFTIFPSALMKLTEEYLGSAKNLTGCSMQNLKENLNSNRPVVAWVNGLGWNVHAVCLTGYNENGFYYNDPWTANKNSFISYDNFYSIWNKPIYDRIFNTSYPSKIALSY